MNPSKHRRRAQRSRPTFMPRVVSSVAEHQSESATRCLNGRRFVTKLLHGKD